MRVIRRLATLLMLALLLPAAAANELEYVVNGLQEPLAGNVRAHLARFRLGGAARVSAGQFAELQSDAEERVREALKPYGYYHPDISSNLVPVGDNSWRMRLQVSPGEPLRVASANVALQGEGSDNGDLRRWRREWPLGPGAVLNQPRWKDEKDRALELARRAGYLDAAFVEQRIEVDVAANAASLALVMETGPQFRFGEVRYEQDALDAWVLENVPRFSAGMPYNKELLEQFRLDLWRTGYFSDIEVREQKRVQDGTPLVDLVVQLESAHRDTYQGTIGFGTDTGIRLQGLWSRHRLSSNGDRIDLGTGYREVDDEFSIRADYRVPRRSAERQFWIATPSLRSENQDLEFRRASGDEGFVKLANGEVRNLNARFGRLHVRDREQGFEQVHETLYTEFVRESFDYRPGSGADPEVQALADDPRFAGLFRNTVNTLVIGIEWDWPAIRGKAFETEGHRERAWLFTANDAWGSERDFTQLYLSSRRSWLVGERWKLLARAEVGYSDADVRELSGTVNGEPFTLSVTQLPDTYRFKAGGGSSVRGYGFEELSNNDIGSNHIIAASVETEFRVSERWSVAAFADIGNAFNDWDQRELRKGVGLGVRWYSIAGPVRVDVARALDIDGRPWRLHFTMGSPLL